MRKKKASRQGRIFPDAKEGAKQKIPDLQRKQIFSKNPYSGARKNAASDTIFYELRREVKNMSFENLQMFSDSAVGNFSENGETDVGEGAETDSFSESTEENITKAFVSDAEADGKENPDIAEEKEQNAELTDEGGKEKSSSVGNTLVRDTVREYLREKTMRSVQQYFEREAEELRKIYPSFSFADEMKNSPEFGLLLRSGVGVRRAYEAVNLEKIMGTALKYAVMSAEKRTADIMKNSGRVTENSISDTASSVKHTDVNSLTEAQIRKIIAEVSRGAKITF